MGLIRRLVGLPYCGPNQRSNTTLFGLELSQALSLPPFPSPRCWSSLEPLPCGAPSSPLPPALSLPHWVGALWSPFPAFHPSRVCAFRSPPPFVPSLPASLCWGSLEPLHFFPSLLGLGLALPSPSLSWGCLEPLRQSLPPSLGCCVGLGRCLALAGAGCLPVNSEEPTWEEEARKFHRASTLQEPSARVKKAPKLELT